MYMKRLKNIYNMEDITIKQYNNGCFEVFQGNKSSDELSFDEMLGLIAALTIPESCLSLLWMKTKEQRDAQEAVINQIAKYPMFKNAKKKEGE